jgi:hypothetical protein
VGGVTVPVVDVVDMIVVGDRFVPTLGAVGVSVLGVGDVRQRVLVAVLAVGAVGVPVVDVIGVALMFDRGMPASGSVLMGVILVHGVLSCAHSSSLL